MSIAKKIAQKFNNVRVGLALGLASADKVIMKDDAAKAPENTNIVSSTVSRHEFVRSIQQGKFTEQQLHMFYKLLDKMDNQHGRVEVKKVSDGYTNPKTGEWVEPEFSTTIISEEKHAENKAKLGDYIPGYTTEMFLINKEVLIQDMPIMAMHEFNGLNGKDMDDVINKETEWIPTLLVKREFVTYGVPKIEDYSHEIFVKIKEGQDFTKDKTCIVEFYCHDYNKKRVAQEAKEGIFGEVNERIYEKLQLPQFGHRFTDFESFLVSEHTATRNAIPHTFDVIGFHSMKKLDKGFVVKIYAEKTEPVKLTKDNEKKMTDLPKSVQRKINEE